MSKNIYSEGNKRKTHPKEELNPGGGDKERYSTGRRDRQGGEAIKTTRRGDFTPTVRMPKSPAPTGGNHPLEKRVGERFTGLKTPALRYASVGNWKGGGQPNPTMGDTLTKDLHMAARSNTGKRPAYTAPGFSGRKASNG